MLGLRWLIWTRAVDDPSIQPLNLHLGSTVYDELSRVPATLSATTSPWAGDFSRDYVETLEP